MFVNIRNFGSSEFSELRSIINIEIGTSKHGSNHLI